MFKSGKSINIEGSRVRNTGGVLASPMITVFGLVLRADNAIPKEVIEFFTAKGAKIDQISEDGDKLVRLSGPFSITKGEMEQFLTKFKDLKLEVKPFVKKQAQGTITLSGMIMSGKQFGNQGNLASLTEINLNFEDFKNSGVLTSPIIRICGLELNVNNLSKEVAEFFTSKGAKIETVQVEGSKCLKLSGNFTILQQDAKVFLEKQNKVKQSLDNKDGKDVAEATNFQKQVQARLRAIERSSVQGLGVQYTYFAKQQAIQEDEAGNKRVVETQEHLYSKIPSGFRSAGATVSIKAGQGITIKDTFGSSAPKDILMNCGGNINLTNQPEEITQTGILSEIISGEDTIFESQTGTVIQNAIVLARGNIDLSSQGEIALGYEHNAAWMNATSIPSLAFAYDAVVAQGQGANDDKSTDVKDNTNASKSKSTANGKV